MEENIKDKAFEKAEKQTLEEELDDIMTILFYTGSVDYVPDLIANNNEYDNQLDAEVEN